MTSVEKKHKNISLNELKLMLDNDLLCSANILKDGDNGYSVFFFKKDNTSYLLVKDKFRDQPRVYKSIDRLIFAMQELGYSYNFKLSFINDNEKTNLEDFKYILGNKLNHVLDDLETHIKYGQEFNYEKDFNQVKGLVEKLIAFTGEYK